MELQTLLGLAGGALAVIGIPFYLWKFWDERMKDALEIARMEAEEKERLRKEAERNKPSGSIQPASMDDVWRFDPKARAIAKVSTRQRLVEGAPASFVIGSVMAWLAYASGMATQSHELVVIFALWTAAVWMAFDIYAAWRRGR